MLGIQNHEALTSIFGHWPSFHDAEVLNLTLDRAGEDGPSLETRIHVWRMTDQVNDQGYFVLDNHTLAILRFGAVVLDWLSGFNHQNVLFELEITEIDPLANENDGCSYRVAMNTSFGCEAQFKCHTICVVSAEPYQPLS